MNSASSGDSSPGLHPNSRPRRRLFIVGLKAAPAWTPTSRPTYRCSATAWTGTPGNGSTLTFDRNILMARRAADRQHAGARAAAKHGQPWPERQPQRRADPLRGPTASCMWLWAIRDAAAGCRIANGPFENAPFVDDTHGGRPRQRPPIRSRPGLDTDGGARRQPVFAVGAGSAARPAPTSRKCSRMGTGTARLAFDPYGKESLGNRERGRTRSARSIGWSGLDGGWIQIMGPQHRFFDYKDIEVTQFRRCAPAGAVTANRLADSRGMRGWRSSCSPGPNTWIRS